MVAEASMVSALTNDRYLRLPTIPDFLYLPEQMGP